MSMHRLKHWILAAGVAAILAPAAYAQKEAAAKGPSISKAVAKQVKTAAFAESDSMRKPMPRLMPAPYRKSLAR